MKNTHKLYYLNFIILCLVFSLGINLVGAVGVSAPCDASTGAVLCYRFNNVSGLENDTYVYDFSGNGNNGTVIGGNNITYINASSILNDGSFNFSGNSHSINVINNKNLLNNTNFTISFWINPRNIKATIVQRIVSKGDLNAGSPVSGVECFLAVTGSRLECMINNQSDAVNRVSVFSDTFSGFSDYNWSFVVLTYDSFNLSLYVNGQLRGQTNVGFKQFISNSLFTIGARNNGLTQGYNGTLDEIIVYNKSYSQSNVWNDYLNYNNLGCVNLSIVNKLYGSSNICYQDYNLDNGIFVNISNVIINGNGSKIFYNLYNRSNIYGITMLSIANVTITNFSFVEYSNNLTIQNNHAIYLSKVNNGSIIGNSIVIIQGNYSSGIYLDRLCGSNYISHNIINTTGYQAYGIFAGLSSNNSIIYKNIVRGLDVYNTWGIHLEYSSFTNISDNYVFINSSNLGQIGYGSSNILFELFSNNNTVINNTLINYAIWGQGLFLATQSDSNSFINNQIYIYGNYSNGIWLSSGGSESIRGSKYNNVSLNNIYGYNGINISGIALESINVSNNVFFQNTVSILNSFQCKGLYSFSYKDAKTYPERNVFVRNIFQTNYYNNCFDIYLLSSFNNTFSFNNFNLGYIYNSTNSFFTGLTNTLFYITNSTGIYLNGENQYYNLSLSNNNLSYVLNNFNLTEGQNRQYSPIYFTSSTSTEKHIASNLTDSVNVTVIINEEESMGEGCEYITKFTYTPKDGLTRTWMGSSARNICNLITTSGYELQINPSSESNVIEWEANRVKDSLSRQILEILVMILAVILCIGALTIFGMYAQNNYQDISSLDLIKQMIIFFIALTLFIVLISYIVEII